VAEVPAFIFGISPFEVGSPPLGGNGEESRSLPNEKPAVGKGGGVTTERRSSCGDHVDFPAGHL